MVCESYTGNRGPVRFREHCSAFRLDFASSQLWEAKLLLHCRSQQGTQKQHETTRQQKAPAQQVLESLPKPNLS